MKVNFLSYVDCIQVLRKYQLFFLQIIRRDLFVQCFYMEKDCYHGHNQEDPFIRSSDMTKMICNVPDGDKIVRIDIDFNSLHMVRAIKLKGT
jgi:hypothetical protein